MLGTTPVHLHNWKEKHNKSFPSCPGGSISQTTTIKLTREKKSLIWILGAGKLHHWDTSGVWNLEQSHIVHIWVSQPLYKPPTIYWRYQLRELRGSWLKRSDTGQRVMAASRAPRRFSTHLLAALDPPSASLTTRNLQVYTESGLHRKNTERV